MLNIATSKLYDKILILIHLYFSINYTNFKESIS